ncbi:MAG: hypothetical protein HY286_14605 [Planctomycetes bacterium]|nr:hypothetical protein [Planctomycetota bacterium]
MTSRANPSDVLALLAKHYQKYRCFKDTPMLERLILLILGREAPHEKVDIVLQKLKDVFVDWNELRLGRIEDMRAIIAESGVSDPESRALRLREMLSKLFTERHMLDAEFLREEDKEKRSTFLAGLPGIDYAMVQAIECSLQYYKTEPDIALSNHLTRVAQRLQWLPKGKELLVSKAKKTLLDISEGDPVNLAYGLVRVAEEYCHSRTPECPNCILSSVCPTSKKWSKEGIKGDAEESASLQ